MPSTTISDAELSLSEKQLFVNDGRLPPESMGLLRPTTLDTPIEEIQRRYKEDGYVFVKGLVPREDILTARRKYFELLAPTNVLKPGTKPVEGIFDTAQDKLNFPGIGAGVANGTDEHGRTTGPNPELAGLFGDLALQAHSEDWYKEDLCRHPAIQDFVAKMTGWGDSTLSIRRTLLRNNMPGNKAIGVHYDQIFLRHGEDTFVTAWVPIGDIKLDGGGLIYLENGMLTLAPSSWYSRVWIKPSNCVPGHRLGAKIEADFTQRAREAGFSDEDVKSAYNQNMMNGGLLANGPAQFAKEHNSRWLLTAYEAGDIVFHNSYAVRCAKSNT